MVVYNWYSRQCRAFILLATDTNHFAIDCDISPYISPWRIKLRASIRPFGRTRWKWGHRWEVICLCQVGGRDIIVRAPCSKGCWCSGCTGKAGYYSQRLADTLLLMQDLVLFFWSISVTSTVSIPKETEAQTNTGAYIIGFMSFLAKLLSSSSVARRLGGLFLWGLLLGSRCLSSSQLIERLVGIILGDQNMGIREKFCGRDTECYPAQRKFAQVIAGLLHCKAKSITPIHLYTLLFFTLYSIPVGISN